MRPFHHFELYKRIENVATSKHELIVFTRCWPHMTLDDTSSDDLLRVSISSDGKLDIVDFTTPSKSGRFVAQQADQKDVPDWIIEAISMLRMADDSSVVHGLGFKVHDKLYYITDKRGGE